MHNHDYSLLGGANRSWVGRWIAMFSAAVSTSLIFLLLWFVDIAAYFKVNVNLPPVAFTLVGASVIWGVFYSLFDKLLWHRLGALVAVPDLRGTWTCTGESLATDGTVLHHWTGTVTIDQNWDKIWLHLRTETSESDSIAAAIVCDHPAGYKLLYHYRNRPRAGQPELHPHEGYASLHFARDRKTAEGEYFNGLGRSTFGRMHLTRT